MYLFLWELHGGDHGYDRECDGDDRDCAKSDRDHA